MNKRKYNNKLLLILTFLVFLLLILGIIFNYTLQKQLIQKNTANYIINYKDYFDKTLIAEVNNIHDNLDFIKEDNKYINLYLKRDKKELYKQTKIIYEKLNKEFDITHLYFIDNNGKVFLRVHDFDKDKDIIDRYTFKKSKDTNHIVHGLEFGIKNNFTLRLVHPWYKNNKLIGYIEIGKEIDKIISDLVKNKNLNTIIAINKSFYKNANKDTLNGLRNKQQTTNYYISYSTIKNINNDLIEFIQSKDSSVNIKLNDKNYIVYKHTLTDVSSKDLGYKILLIDVTKEYENLFTQFLFYISLMSMGTILMLFVGYKFSRYYQSKINQIFINLNEEKIKVEKLSNEQKTLLELFDIGEPVLFKWNNHKEWSVSYVSNNVEKLLGYSKEDFLNQKIKYIDCIYSEDLEIIFQKADNVVNNKSLLKNSTYRVVDKNGKIKWILDYTLLVKNKKDNTDYFLGYIIDISEMKDLQNSVQQEKILLKSILDSSNAIIATIDKNGVMTNINKYGCEFVGFSQEEISSKPYFWFDRFIPSDVKPDIKLIIELVKKQDKIISTKTNSWIDKNGEQRPIEWSNSLLYDMNNNIEGIITVGIDVSKRYKKELELVEEKNKFQQFVNYATDGVHILDKNGNVLDCSYSFAEMLQYTKEEVLNLNVKDWEVEDNKDNIIEFVRELMKTPSSFERKHKRKDGSTYIAQIKTRGVTLNKEEYLYASARDITIEKDAYNKLEKFIDLQDNIIILTDGFNISYANKNFFKLTSFENIELFKEKYDDICDLFIDNGDFFSLEKTNKKRNWIKNIEKLPDNKRVVAILSKNYNIHAFSLNINYFENNLYIVSLSDISQTMIEKVNLKRKTLHDKLTNTYNREYFEQNYQILIKSSIQNNLYLCVAFLDIDYFKKVNDIYGHSIGDDVLIEFVDTIIKNSRVNDRLIRWGGEEFILLFELKTQENLFNILENLRKAVENTNFKVIKNITCSIGGTIYIDNEDIYTTINRADEAVYIAKDNGRNKVVLK